MNKEEAVLQEILVTGAKQEDEEKRRQESAEAEEAAAKPASDTSGAPEVVKPPLLPLVAKKAAKGSIGGEGMVEMMLASGQGRPGRPPLLQTVSSRTGRRPPDGAVVENRLPAGDLHVPPLVSHRSNASQQRQEDGSGPPAPSEFQFDDLEEEERKDKKRFYHHYSFWGWALPMTVSLCLLTAGIVLYILARHQKVIRGFELWRWCIFFSAFPPIWFAGDLFVRLLVSLVESQFLRTRNVMYYMVAMRKPLANLLRAALLVPLFVVIFHTKAHVNSTVHTVYDNVLKFIACLVLFTLANVLKTLIAKKMAFHFHKATHFQKMQEAIRKEYYLLALSEPRTHNGLCSSQPTDGTEGDAHKDNPVKARTLVAKLGATVGLPNFMADTKRAASMPAPETHHEEMDPEAKPQAADEKSPSQLPSRHVSVSFRDSSIEEGTPLRRAGRGSADVFGMGSPKSEGRRSGVNTPRTSVTNTSEARKRRSGAVSPVLMRSRHVQRLHKDTISLQVEATGKAAPAGRAANDAMIAKITQVEKHIRKNQLAINFTDQLGQAKNSNSEREAKKLAFYLYWNIKPYFNRNHIVVEDLEDFLPPKDAEEAFAMLDDNDDGKVSLSELREAVKKIYRERANLAVQLKDTKTVVGRLEYVVGLVLHIIFVFFYLSIFNVNIQRTWVMLSSVVLAFAFVFGNSIRTLYEAVIYLFIVHPFDVGDSVTIDAETYKVEEISLTTIVLKRGDGGRVWYPIAKMSGGLLLNLSRSDNKWDKFKFLVDLATPVSVLEELVRVFEAHHEECPTEFTGSKSVNFALEDKEHMKVAIVVGFEYSHNGVDGGRTGKARTKLLVAIVERLKALGIQYTQNPTLPYDKSPAGLAEERRERAEQYERALPAAARQSELVQRR